MLKEKTLSQNVLPTIEKCSKGLSYAEMHLLFSTIALEFKTKSNIRLRQQMHKAERKTKRLLLCQSE